MRASAPSRSASAAGLEDETETYRESAQSKRARQAHDSQILACASALSLDNSLSPAVAGVVACCAEQYRSESVTPGAVPSHARETEYPPPLAMVVMVGRRSPSFCNERGYFRVCRSALSIRRPSFEGNRPLFGGLA